MELADGITPQDIKLFLTEADEQLQLLDEDIVRLERESGNVKLLQEIFRASHTIKGSSAMIGHQRMSHLAHGMENVLDKVRKGALAVSSSVIDALLKGLDGLRILREELVTGEESRADINTISVELEAAMLNSETDPKASIQNRDNQPLDNESKTKLEEALSKGEHAFRINVVVNKVTTWVAVRCFQVVQELSKIATVINSNPSLSEIEAGHAGSTIELLIITVKDEKTINNTIASIPEIDKITVCPYIVEEAAVSSKEKTPDSDPTPVKKEDVGLRQTIRVDVSRLDTLMEQIGELVINRNHISQIGKTLAEKYTDDELIRTLNDSLSQTGKIVNILQQDIMTIRMLPIDLVFNTMPRMVRDLARKTGKKVDFIVEGQETEVDRSVIEHLRDPLIHLLRNSVDHGIEMPAERRTAGKPAIILKAASSRDIYNQGQTTIIFLVLTMAFGSILFGLLFVFVMRKTILKRLEALTQGVNVIGRAGDTSRPISLPPPIFKGRDELSDLADNINNMVDKIKETGTKLAYQELLFERLLLYSPAIILAVDGNVNITLVNKAFCTLFNVREDDAIGKPLSAFIPPEEIAVSAKQISDVEGSVTIFEHHPKIGGIEMIIDTTIITVRHNEYLLIGRDITQEREEQNKLYLNDRLASVGEMAAGIAHELNNPLTGIVMLSQLLMQTNLPPDVKNDLSDINSEANRATDVVRNLLAFARKQLPAKRLTQINKTINDVLKLRSYEETVNNINVITTLDPDLPEIMVDNIQIQQVFLNLVLNAEYSMIHAHKKGLLEVDSSVSDGKVVVSFTDDGEGIKEENMKKMFQPFFTTKEVGVGTGLGLSLCYGIIKRHGGMIYVKSKYGSGATFTIELPIDTSKLTENGNGLK